MVMAEAGFNVIRFKPFQQFQVYGEGLAVDLPMACAVLPYQRTMYLPNYRTM